jgi:hypothetical protein
MPPAKLPNALRGEKPRKVADTLVGERFVLFSVDMIVDLDGSCFLQADSDVRSTSPLPPLTLLVERGEDGFHVTADEQNSWMPREIGSKELILPVASITIAKKEGVE